MDPAHRDFYDKLRKQIDDQAGRLNARYGRKVAGWLFALPDLFVLCARLMFDPRVSFASKGVLGVALLYMISPVDLIPEAIFGPFGLLDDLAIVILALHKMRASQPDAGILRELWSGDGDIIALIDETAAKLNDFVDEKILANLRKLVGND